MSKISEHWDKVLKPKLNELLEKFDKVDKLSQYYLSQAMWYVEHDLADGRDPRHRLLQCWDVFKEESFRDIKEFTEFKDLIKESADMIGTYLNMEAEQ